MKESKWPKWIRIFYYRQDTNKNNGYRGSVNNQRMIAEVLDRLNIRQDSIISFEIDGELLNEDRLTNLFNWLEKEKREMEEK